MSVVGLACAMADGFSSLLILRLLQGIGIGGEMPVAAVYMSELSKAHGRGRFFLLYELVFPIGLLAAGQIGALLVPSVGWQIMFWIGGIPGLLIAVLLLRLSESPRWLIETGRLTEAEAILRQMEGASPTPIRADSFGKLNGRVPHAHWYNWCRPRTAVERWLSGHYGRRPGSLPMRC